VCEFDIASVFVFKVLLKRSLGAGQRGLNVNEKFLLCLGFLCWVCWGSGGGMTLGEKREPFALTFGSVSRQSPISLVFAFSNCFSFTKKEREGFFVLFAFAKNQCCCDDCDDHDCGNAQVDLGSYCQACVRHRRRRSSSSRSGCCTWAR
jgi:hypothetical protein